MPLYEYLCEQCSARFERIEKASAIRDERCPECGGTAHRLMSAPALQFKGSGWYVTDYGKGNGSRPATGETGSSESAPGPAADSTPKKTDKKTDTKVA